MFVVVGEYAEEDKHDDLKHTEEDGEDPFLYLLWDDTHADSRLEKCRLYGFRDNPMYTNQQNAEV